MPKLVDHESFRADLALRSFDLFASRGPGAVTTRQLASALGVSTGTLYHYFGSKQALFEHMVEQSIAQHMVRVKALGHGATAIDRATALLQYVEDTEAHMRALLFVIIDYLRLATGGADDFFDNMLEQFVPTIMKLLELEDATIAEALVAYVDGLLIRRAAMSNPPPLSQHAAPIVTMLLAHIQATAPAKDQP